MTNRWIRIFVQAAIVVVAMSVAAPSWAGPHSDIVRPFVMLLLDTSGSMEWEPGADVLPTCASALGDERSRWMMIEEVLTGTYSGYSCHYEPRVGDQEGYYIPHVENDNMAQDHDGIMELFDDEIEFGIATIDSFPSPDSGPAGMWSYPIATDPVVAWDRYEVQGLEQGINWQESATCAYFWNLGIRSESASVGAMTAHNWGGTAPGSHHSRNVHAQQSIQEIVPYWSSPLNAALYDTYYYFLTHRATQAMPGGDDCWADCRPHHVILITDGTPNNDGQPECGYDVTADPPTNRACPYPQAWEVAEMMYSESPRIYLHVVGFSALNTSGTIWDSGGSPQAVDLLEHLGRTAWGGAVGDCPVDPDGNPECVLYADDAAQLRAALGRVFDNILEGTRTRTKTSTNNTIVPTTSGGVMGQHQLFSSTEISVGGTWEGNLERVTYKCGKNVSGDWELQLENNGGIDRPTVFNFGDEGLDLVNIGPDDLTTRKLYTTDPAVAVYPNPTATRPLPFYALDDSISEAVFEVSSAGDRNNLTRWMHGCDNSQRADDPADADNRRLGAIYHTTPVVVGPPTLELPLASYNAGEHVSAINKTSGNREAYTSAGGDEIGFRQLYARRPYIIYVASTDGILHAFDINASDIPGTNPEIWGFIPPMLLPRLRMNMLGQHYLLDGQITVADMRLKKEIDGSGVDEWATLLVMGLRDGGGLRGYFALDVTAPFPGENPPSPGAAASAANLGEPADPTSGNYGDPELLWQITPTTPTDPLTAEALQNYGAIGLTYTRPAFGTIIFDDGGGDEEIAVVILPGGVRPLQYWDPDDTDGDDDFWEDYPLNAAAGCGLYVVRATDGRLIRWLHPTLANCSVDGSGNAQCGYVPSDNFDCQIVGAPLALGGIAGELTTRVFVGDSQGRLYRADLSNPDPMQWELDPFFSLFHNEVDPQPIYNAPAAALDDRGLVTLVFGSGDPDDLQSRPVNRMASITEMFNLGANLITDGNTCHTIYADVDGTATLQQEFQLTSTLCDSGSGVGARVFPYVNWVLEFTPIETPASANLGGAAGGPNEDFVTGERVLGSPVIFDEVAYFSTFVPSPDLNDCCVEGYGRVMGIHYLGNDPDDTVTDDVVSQLSGAGSIEIHQMGGDEIAYGVSIVREPSCSTISQDALGTWIPDLTTSGRPSYRLVVHNNADTAPPILGGDAPDTGFDEITLTTPPIQCRPNSWVSAFGF